MKKWKRMIKRWIGYYGLNAAGALLSIFLLGIGLWYAFAGGKEEVEKDTAVSVEAFEEMEVFSEESYERALLYLIEGEEQKGRSEMVRLSPLSQISKTAQGIGGAHLWMAENLLEASNFNFINVFPIEYNGGRKVSAPSLSSGSQEVKLAIAHLEAAIELSPGMSRPVQLLAELQVVLCKRNEAVELLLGASSREDGKLLYLGVAVANAMIYAGDDLALRESAWHNVATLGKRVTSGAKGDIGVRLSYLLNALVLREFDLAATGIDKFERDFEDRAIGEVVTSELRATHAYFRAIEALGNSDVEFAMENLLRAQSFQVKHDYFIKGLELLKKRHPELEEGMRLGIESMGAGLEVENPRAAAKLSLLKSQLFPDLKSKFIKQAAKYDQADAAVAIAYLEEQIEMGNPNVESLSKLVEKVLRQPDLAKEDEASLHLNYGKLRMHEGEWRTAVASLEKALVLSSSKKDIAELHKLLAKTYEALGMYSMATEHRALVD